MPTATSVKVSTPVSVLSPLTPSNTATAIQSGPYTKAQFQSTMEGSRTVKTSTEVEHILRDYPAALELYRTGKYKVKVKCDTDVERVILVEKRISKVTANNSTKPNDNQENNQTVPDISTKTEQDKEIKKIQEPEGSRSRTHSRDPVAPTISATNGNNIVHTTISSMRMTSNTQPKVDHHRTPSRDREVSVTPQQKQNAHSNDNQVTALHSKQQGRQINREYPKMMVPYVQNMNNSGNLWQQQQQQQRPQQAYFSNPLLLQQQRANLYRPSTLVPQQNPLYRQPYYIGQRPAVPVAYPQQQTAYPAPSIRTVGKTDLYSTNTYSASSRSMLNSSGLPPSFRTFHSNQQPVSAFHPMYRAQVPFPMNHPWSNMSANEPVGVMMNNNDVRAEQQRGARNRARSVDPRPRNNPPSLRLFNVPQQPVGVFDHQYQRHRPRPTNNVGPSVEDVKEQNVPFKEPTSLTNGEKLTVRQLNETFMQADPSGRVPCSSLPGLIQRFGMTLTENDILSAAKDLNYNVNEPISARRLVHILVKLGKITKSTQQRPPVSPSMLPEDREVTDIMTQRKAIANNAHSSNQPNQ